MLKGGIELEVYCEEDLETPIDKYLATTRKVTFYIISSLEPNDDTSCFIISAGEEYHVKATYEFVKSKINDRQSFMFN